MRWLLAVTVFGVLGCQADKAWPVAPGAGPVPNPLAQPAGTCPCPAPVTEAATSAAATITTAAGVNGATLFQTKTCIACHGKDAKTPILPNYPRIAGQQAAYIEQQMKDIKAGTRANGQTAAMKGIMGLVDDEEIHVLAAYVSSLK